MTMDYSTEVRYHPWVGERYREQQPRWLILGESSYGLGLTETCAVQEMIRAHCGATTDSFETGVYRVCAGAERLMTGQYSLDPATKVAFWQTVAFYNYVRDSLSESTSRPTPVQYAQSLAAFNEVVCELKPHVVLVLGIGLWDALPSQRKGWVKGPELELSMPTNSRKLSLWTGHAEHDAERHSFLCFPVVHPSRQGFAAGDWKDWMTAAKAAVAANSIAAGSSL